MIHYHGTPITPKEQFYRLAGMNFCVSYAQDQDLKKALQIGQSVLFDNGAFSAWRLRVVFDEAGYLRWLDPVLAHPHWAIIPDVIDGSEEENDAMLFRWPRSFGKLLGAPVWHLGESIERLERLVGEWPRICLGSSGQYREIGTAAWSGRMDEAFNRIAQISARLPWIHGLRMLGQAGGAWPLASADSTNVAQNWKRDTGCAYCKAAALDAVQAPGFWRLRPTQGGLDV